MHRHLVSAAIATLILGTPTYGVLIDNFQAPQVLESTSAVIDIEKNQVTGAGMLTGWRDFALLANGNSGPRMEAANGVLTIEAGANSAPLFGVTWDGPRSFTPLSPDVGYGPMDLTDGGSSNAIVFTVLHTDAPIDFTLTLWQGDNRDDWYVVNVPGGAVTPTTFVIPFESFQAGSSSGIKADYSKINSVTLLAFPFPAEATLQLGAIETVFVPEPSTVALASLGLIGLVCLRCRKASRS
jgi:hypothetical protein